MPGGPWSPSTLGWCLESTGIKAVTSAMTIILVVVWIYVSYMTTKALVQKTLLWPGMDEDMEDIEGHPQNGQKER